MKKFLKFTWGCMKLSFKVWYGCFIIGLIFLLIEFILIICGLNFLNSLLNILSTI